MREVTANDLGRIEQILDRRVNAMGVAEPLIQQQRPDRVIVELPGIKDPEAAKARLQTTAMLEFRDVPRKYAFGEEHKPEYSSNGEVSGFTLGSEVVPAANVIGESPVIASGTNLRPNSTVKSTTHVQVTFELVGAARDRFREYTRANINHYLAIVLDGKMISCPIVRAVIPGDGVIEGGFDGPGGLTEARDLSVLLNAGALPFDLELVENRTVSPELGAEALQRSLEAGLIGLCLVLIFMVAYYRLPGLVADAALLIYCALLLGAIKLVGQVLTLPGILAVIISIGMAVDANVIIFERLKEEIRSGKTMRSAVDAGFKRAWAAIFDSNVCSIGTGIVLAAFGTGPIKGFAVALIVGVVVSLFTAVTVSRLFMTMVVDSRLGRNVRLFGVSPRDVRMV
jgi:protein-export membrane protein SecD